MVKVKKVWILIDPRRKNDYSCTCDYFRRLKK
jgi:hypothetical protein